MLEGIEPPLDPGIVEAFDAVEDVGAGVSQGELPTLVSSSSMRSAPITPSLAVWCSRIRLIRRQIVDRPWLGGHLPHA